MALAAADPEAGTGTGGASSADPSPSASASSRTPLLARTRAHLLEPLTTRWTDLFLFVCCFTSGLTDAAAFAAWSTFLAMQTGNTIFLALGASGQPANAPDAWLKSLVSIACFVLGCLVFPRAMRLAGHGGRARVALAGTFTVQTLFCVVAAALVRAGVVPSPDGVVPPAERDPRDPMLIELAGIALLAFQAGGQIVASRVLGFSEVPTVVLTSVYCDLTGDENILKKDNPKRNRRLLAVTLILLGGIAGGWITRSPGGMDVVIWMAAGLKFTIAAACMFWKKASDKT